jgi:RsmE family RNA methyltransferase
MNQIIIRPEECTETGDVVLKGRRASHVTRILQAQPGQTVRVALLNGNRGQGEVTSIRQSAVHLQCRFDDPPLPPTGITLLLALPRPKVMYRLFAPLAASGVETLILTNAAKVERTYFDTHWLQAENYEPLLMEGLEQSGETRLPRIRIERRLKPLVEDELTIWPGARLLLHPHTTARPATQAPTQAPILVAVGPEGGWTDYEVDLFHAHGFTCIVLGMRILRSDIAVHGILGILQCLALQGKQHGERTES